MPLPDPADRGRCSVCGKASYHPQSNKCDEHRGPSKRKGAGKKATATREQSTAAKVVGQLPAIDAKTFSGKAPTATEWEEKLGAVVVLLTMTYIEFGVIKPSGLQEPYATQMTDRLAMTDDEAATIVEPFAHWIAPTKLNKDHGREAIELLAFAPAILAVVEWQSRVSRFKKEMQQSGGEVQLMPDLPERMPDRGSDRRPEAPQSPERTEPVPTANFGGGGGVWDPDQAPTARVHPNGNVVVDPNRTLEAAHTALNGAAASEDGWVGVAGEG